MDRLGRLWIEMFQYEKMPEAPEREQVLVILDQGQRKLAEEAAGMMLAGKGWRIRVTDRLPELAERDIQAQYWVLAEERVAAREFVPPEANLLIYPKVYGLEEKECRHFPEYDPGNRIFVPGNGSAVCLPGSGPERRECGYGCRGRRYPWRTALIWHGKRYGMMKSFSILIILMAAG